MKNLLLTIAAMVAFQAGAQAESSIIANCAGTKPGSIPEEFANFSTEKERRANPASYVQAMDALLANGPFKGLLDCRDQLKADPQFKYALRFLGANEREPMSVARDRQYEGLMAKVSITLTFKLTASPQKTFFTYLHELTHVCQDYHWADLQTKYDISRTLPQNFLGGMGMGWEWVQLPIYLTFQAVQIFQPCQLITRILLVLKSRPTTNVIANWRRWRLSIK